MPTTTSKQVILEYTLLPILLIGIPAVVVTLYYSLFTSGNQEITTSIMQQEQLAAGKLEPIVPALQTGRKIAPVDELTVALEKRLANNPNDPAGWLLLAKSWQHLQKVEKARAAYNRARHYGATDASLEQQLAVGGS